MVQNGLTLDQSSVALQRCWSWAPLQPSRRRWGQRSPKYRCCCRPGRCRRADPPQQAAHRRCCRRCRRHLSGVKAAVLSCLGALLLLVLPPQAPSHGRWLLRCMAHQHPTQLPLYAATALRRPPAPAAAAAAGLRPVSAAAPRSWRFPHGPKRWGLVPPQQQGSRPLSPCPLLPAAAPPLLRLSAHRQALQSRPPPHTRTRWRRRRRPVAHA